jgi:hypothetical protein
MKRRSPGKPSSLPFPHTRTGKLPKFISPFSEPPHTVNIGRQERRE